MVPKPPLSGGMTLSPGEGQGPGEVQKLLNELDREIAVLDDAVKGLASRLNPVLSQGDSQTHADRAITTMATCPVGNILHGNISCLHSIQNVVRRLLEDLTL